MKKILLSTLILCMCLTTGCTKNYKTVTEYSNAMTEVRKGLGDYTIEIVISNKDQDTYYKSYIKGDKWKSEVSKNAGKSYGGEGILYDGNEVYTYSTTERIAMSIPFKQIIEKQGLKDQKTTDMIMKFINPTGLVYNWNLATDNLDTIKFGKKNAVKNDFKCRMLLSEQDNCEFCISDKYGIAVYARIKEPKKGDMIELNVKKINNLQLSDYDLGLPHGVKKISMADLFQNLANMMK